MFNVSVRRGPVDLPADVIPFLPSGRVRLAALPIEPFGFLRPTDQLWVRESVTVERGARAGGVALVRYNRDRVARRVPWPDGFGDLASGRVKAGAMPLPLSRFTLHIVSVRRVRLLSIGAPEAVAGGVEPRDGGWAPAGALEGFLPFRGAGEALGHVFGFGPGAGGGEVNPLVAVVAFAAVARNVERPGTFEGSRGAWRG